MGLCYGYGLLMIVLLYEDTPELIWGYHYVNFLVFTYVSDRFLRFWAHVQYRRSQWLMGMLLKHSRLVYCIWRYPWLMGDIPYTLYCTWQYHIGHTCI